MVDEVHQKFGLNPRQIAARRELQRRIGYWIAALLALTVFTIAAIWIIAHGSITEALQIPPKLDPSTPAVQGHYKFLDIERAGPDGQCHFNVRTSSGTIAYTTQAWSRVGVLIHTDRIPPDIYPPTNASPEKKFAINEASEKFGIALSGPNGEKLEVGCGTIDAETIANRNEIPGGMLIVSFSALPQLWNYVDITCKSRLGDQARWRLTNLPRFRRVIPVDPKIDDTKTVDGITMHLIAHRSYPAFNHNIPEVMAKAYCTSASIAGSTYEVDWFGFTTEHAPYPSDLRWPFYSDQYPVALCHYWDSDDAKDGIGAGFACDYAGNEKFVRVRGVIRKFAILDEPVVFHDIDFIRNESPMQEPKWLVARVYRDQSATTPSGTTVTLKRQNVDIQNNIFQQPSIMLSPAFSYEPKFYPNSVLCRRYMRPATLEYAMMKPLSSGCWYSDEKLHPSCEVVGLYSRNNHYKFPAHVDNFTVIVRQRVELKDTPFTMTTKLVDGSEHF